MALSRLLHSWYRPRIFYTFSKFLCLYLLIPFKSGSQFFILIIIDLRFRDPESESLLSGFRDEGLFSRVYYVEGYVRRVPLHWVWTIANGLNDLGVWIFFLIEKFGNSYKIGLLLIYGCFMTLYYFLFNIFYISRGEQCPIREGLSSTCRCMIFLFI